MRNRMLACRSGIVTTGAVLAAAAGWMGTASAALGADTPAPTTTVHFRLIDSDTGHTTPAMACITGSEKKDVRLPPDGRVCTEVSRVPVFLNGVRYSADRNWIGPVRKTMGKGDNNDRAWVYEVRPSLPYWAEPVMYQVSGDFTIALPAGHWRIAVERGMEYIPVVEEFEVDGTGEVEKTLELKRWINMAQRGWHSGDVHVHHPILDDAHKEFLLQWAVASDLNVVNVLEMGHHGGTDFKQMGFGKDYRVQAGKYALAAGQECPRSTFGHIIGLNTSEMARDVTRYDFYDVAFKKIHDQPGTLVGFAHLAWNGCDLPRGFPWYVTTGEVDFVELLQFSVLNAMDYYDYLNLGFRLTAAAGSDMPWGSTIGEVRTYVYTGAPLDLDTWFARLKKGNTFVSNGPALEFTVDGELPGTELKKAVGSKVKIVAKALGYPKMGLPKALTIVGNEGAIKEVLNTGGQTELAIEMEYTLPRSHWLVASTVCDNGALAHTTPVYVVVDGQPTWCPKRGPGVIDKQLEAIDKIAKEFPNEGEHGKGIHERLERAKAYYANLRKQMAAAK